MGTAEVMPSSTRCWYFSQNLNTAIAVLDAVERHREHNTAVTDISSMADIRFIALHSMWTQKAHTTFSEFDAFVPV